jgi:hypothetical protein
MEKNNAVPNAAKQKSKRNSFARRILILALLVLILVLVSLSITGQTGEFWWWLPAGLAPKSNSQPAVAQASPSSQSQAPILTLPATASPTASATTTPLPLVVYTSTPANADQNPPINLDDTDFFKGSLVLSITEGAYAHLFAYRPQTLPFVRLTSGPWQDITPSTSPDGTQLAFASNRNGHWDLYLLDLRSGETRQITDTPEYDAAPSWSPDGRWLVYESYLQSS